MTEHSEPEAFRSIRVLDQGDGLDVRSKPVSIGFGILTLVFTVALIGLAVRGVYQAIVSGHLGAAASSLGVFVVGGSFSGLITIFAFSHQRLTIRLATLSLSWMLFGLTLRREVVPLAKVGRIKRVIVSAADEEGSGATFLEIPASGRKLRFRSGDWQELERLANLCNRKLKTLPKRVPGTGGEV